MSVIQLLFSTGTIRRPRGVVGAAIGLAGAALACAVVYFNIIEVVDAFAGTIVFLCAMLGLAFLVIGASPSVAADKVPVYDYLLSAAGFACGIFFFIEAERVITRITLLDPLSTGDYIFGSLAVALALEMTRRAVGLGLMLIVGLFILYNLFGDTLPGVMGHGEIGYTHFLDITAFTTDGLFGVPVKVAATYAFMFVLFGALLAAARGSEFFYNISAIIAGKRPGGPAKVAVVSSGLYGMISGSPVSDVVTTGSITIPMMKRLGYRPAFAGAVEVTASTGGSILPPVMGSAAFIMAEFTGIDYGEIVIAAIIPALLYYIGVYSQVHFRSLSIGLTGIDPAQIPRLGATLRTGGVFVVPLGVLVAALALGYSAEYVAAAGSSAVLAVVVVAAAVRTLTGLVPALAELLLEIVAIALPIAALVAMLLLGAENDVALAVAGGVLLGEVVVILLLAMALRLSADTIRHARRKFALLALVLRQAARGQASAADVWRTAQRAAPEPVRRTAWALAQLYAVLAETTRRMIPVTAACAAAGLVIGGLTMTGLAMKTSNLILLASGGDKFLSLVLAAIVTIILGLGMPTPSAYILAAVMVGPTLKTLGFSVMASNMFLLYFAVMSAITPPVAVAAYAAAGIAEANPLAIAARAVKLALAAFIVPFAFVYAEPLLMHGSVFDIVQAGVTAVAGVILLAAAAEGHLAAPLPGWARLGLAGAAVALIVPNLVVALVGAVAAAAIIAVLRLMGRRPRAVRTPSGESS